MKLKFLATMLLAAGMTFGAQVSFGISIGTPPPVRVLRYRPPVPGPGFVWVNGYWYPVGHRYLWHQGYWTRPPYAGALWVAPRYDSHAGRFFNGYWNGDHGRFDHDHHWDHDRARDYNRLRGHGHEQAHNGDHGRGHEHDHH